MKLEELMQKLGELPADCLEWPVFVQNGGAVVGIAEEIVGGVDGDGEYRLSSVVLLLAQYTAED